MAKITETVCGRLGLVKTTARMNLKRFIRAVLYSRSRAQCVTHDRHEIETKRARIHGEDILKRCRHEIKNTCKHTGGGGRRDIKVSA